MRATQAKLDYLAARLLESEAGRLYPSAARMVFGEGAPEADLVVVGEAPGAEEDRTGRPFVGPSGQLLDRVLAKGGLPRERVYICNVIKRRPPGNRDPSPEEVQASLPWLHAQILLLQPKVLLAVGKVAANTLAATEDLPIGALRERKNLIFEHTKLPQPIPVVATYHPAYILRSLEHGSRELEKFARDIKKAIRISSGHEVQVLPVGT